MWKPLDTRPRGRLKPKWEDQVIRNIKNMEILRWREQLRDRGSSGESENARQPLEEKTKRKK